MSCLSVVDLAPLGSVPLEVEQLQCLVVLDNVEAGAANDVVDHLPESLVLSLVLSCERLGEHLVDRALELACRAHKKLGVTLAQVLVEFLGKRLGNHQLLHSIVIGDGPLGAVRPRDGAVGQDLMEQLEAEVVVGSVLEVETPRLHKLLLPLGAGLVVAGLVFAVHVVSDNGRTSNIYNCSALFYRRFFIFVENIILYIVYEHNVY